MKKNVIFSLLVSVMVLAVMAGAGMYLLAEDNQELLAGGLVDAAAAEANLVTALDSADEKPDLSAGIIEENNDEALESGDAAEADGKETEVSAATAPVAAVSDQVAAAPVEDPADESPASAYESAVVQTAAKAPVDYRAEEKAQESSQSVEAPAASPTGNEAVIETAAQQVSASRPVTYSWGSTGNYTFRMEVKVTNNGSDTSQNVTVAVPLLENSSPYQTTTLKSTNFDIVSTSGRVRTFNLGDLAPGESKTIIADFAITVKTVSINSTNETVEKARQIFEKHAGSGNCRDLARAFINESRNNGINAREVIGFARPQRGAMTAGSLQGSRHSWAEFYVDGLGWVPVDLTFKYFGSFPYTSHIVESYSDQSLKVNFTGGSLSATWSNAIL